MGYHKNMELTQEDFLMMIHYQQKSIKFALESLQNQLNKKVEELSKEDQIKLDEQYSNEADDMMNE